MGVWCFNTQNAHGRGPAAAANSSQLPDANSSPAVPDISSCSC